MAFQGDRHHPDPSTWGPKAQLFRYLDVREERREFWVAGKSSMHASRIDYSLTTRAQVTHVCVVHVCVVQGLTVKASGELTGRR